VSSVLGESRGNIVEQHIPCPMCSSTDGYCTYDNGWGHCYSCNGNKKLTGGKMNGTTNDKTGAPSANQQKGRESYEVLPHRGIPKKAFETYSVYTKLVEDVPISVQFPYGDQTAKYRAYDEVNDEWPKSNGGITSSGNMSQASLFGKNVFPPGKVITITEGEFDALAVHAMTSAPAVSIRNAATAKTDCQKEYDYLNSFDKIVLCMDMDLAGDKAATAIAPLFDFNKVVRVNMHLHKDANDYILSSHVSEFLTAWKGAKKYTPDNIINSFDSIAKSLRKTSVVRLGTYPFPGLQTSLHGLYMGEMVVFKGDEGIGKTELFRAMEHHLLKETDKNIGILHLEEDKSTTIKGVATYERKYPFTHLQDSSSEQEILEAYKEAVSNDDSRLYIYDSFDVEDEDKLLDNIRFLVSACNCSFIFLDHITWLATGLQNEDERRKLDRISQKLKLLTKELSCCIILISHTNKEGGTRGSSNITKVANTVISMHRDVTADTAEQKNLYFTIEKGRGGGTKTGRAEYATFDEDTLRLIEPDYVSPMDDREVSFEL